MTPLIPNIHLFLFEFFQFDERQKIYTILCKKYGLEYTILASSPGSHIQLQESGIQGLREHHHHNNLSISDDSCFCFAAVFKSLCYSLIGLG